MKRNLPFLSLVVFVVMSAALTASAQFKPWSGSSIVQDPEWQKSFLGSYGFLSGVEPDIKPSELSILKDVIDLMKVNPRAALAMLEQRMGDDNSAALDFIVANLRFQQGDLANATTSYEKALQKFPDFRRAHKNLGLLMVQVNEYKGAVEHLTRAIELGDRDGRTYGLLGYGYINLDNPLSAEQAYRTAVLQQPDSKDWQLGLARSLLSLEKYEEAAALFSTILEQHPEDASVWKLQANAFIGLDQPLAAAVNLEALRMLGKADLSSLVLLGDIYMNEGIRDLAKDAYLAAIAKDTEGTQFEAAYRAADLLFRAAAYDQSAEILASIDRRYGKKLPEDANLELMTLRARIARAQGREAEAVSILEDIVQRDGTRGDALLELARYNRDQGNDQKALLLLERAQNIPAYVYDALIERAQFLVAGKDYEQAASLLRQALRIKSESRVERFLARVEGAVRQ